jgi:hypothetical protein
MIWLASAAGSITSPVFHKFVLVVDDAHCPGLFGRVDERGALMILEQTLWSLSQRTGMKMTVKERHLPASFRDEVEKAFPIMLSAGMLEFELTDPPQFLY